MRGTIEESNQTAVLWGVDDIAAYYGRSRKKAYAIVKVAGFPKPVRGDKGRWVAAAVQAWAERADEPTPVEVLVHTRPVAARVVRRKAA